MELRYWGHTEADADNAKTTAQQRLWMIFGGRASLPVITRESRYVGGTCPIKRGDGNAAFICIEYDGAYGFYETAKKCSIVVGGEL